MSDPDIDQQILDFVELHSPIERHEVFSYFTKIAKGEVGNSDSAFKRRINGLTRDKKVHTLEDKELDAYGITRADNRFSYLVSTSASQLKTHLDSVFKLLKNPNAGICTLALAELEMHQEQYQLSARQLDELISVLQSKNLQNADTTTRLLQFYAAHGRLPFAKEKFQEVLKAKLKEISPTANPKGERKHNNFLDKLIYLLGELHDPIVLEELKKDAASNMDYGEYLRIYQSEGLANVIEEHRTELFQYQILLEKQKKHEQAIRIQQIRGIAHNALRMKKAEKKNSEQKDEQVEII